MGNKVSISFRKGEQESVSLFSHWDGMAFVDEAKSFIDELKKRPGSLNPLGRFNPDTVMMDFIRDLTKTLDRVESNYYLGKSENDGDNSDNGHHVIDLTERTESLYKFTISYKGQEIYTEEVVEAESSTQAKEIILDHIDIDVIPNS